MVDVSPSQFTQTDQERAIGKEIKRCRVQYRLVSDGSDVVVADLVLSDLGIVIKKPNDEGSVYKEIFLEDFLGAEIFSTSSADVCRLEINSFPATKRNSKNFRQLEVDSVLFPTTNSEGIKRVVEWRNALHRECERSLRKTFVFEEKAPVDDNWQRRYLVLINPVAGSGQGVRKFEEHVRPMFQLADIALNVLVTEYSGHASSVVKTYDLSLINGIILSSGDGLFYEVVNALMEREDWKTAIKTPLGIIPTGTGNAMCASLLQESKETFSVVNAAFQIIRGGVRPMDLASIQAGGQVRHMAILSCWGFVADTDIDSENMRALGKDTRYVLYSIKNIVERKSYFGRLHYLPMEDNETDLMDFSADHKQMGGSIDQSECKSQTLHGNVCTKDIVHLETNERDKQIVPPDVTKSLSTNQAMDPNNTVPKLSSLTKNSPPRIPLRLLPPTTDSKLPSNWRSVEGNFVLFGVLMVPLVAEGFYGYPGVKLGSGYFTIGYGLDNLTRLDLLHILITGGTGEFLCTSEKFITVKAKAFRVEPFSSTGVITVDGEVIPYGPLQGEIHENFIRVYSRKRIC